MKYKITERDVYQNPILVKMGINEGDLVELAEEKVTSHQSTTDENENLDDGGIEVPKKPPPPEP